MKTLKLRIKDKHASALAAMAREVNQVWNYVNELSLRSIRERHKWLSAYDLQKYTAGFSKCEGVKVGSPTVQLVCEEYAPAISPKGTCAKPQALACRHPAA
ncbi:hypothetical protein [Polaromonas naphthalenivorans]|uniref:Transposase n=1 Tax=Polaromonas naphthalenivorans (strain CJ2) TaxID=365044 RepID=A1VR79_POLNA|nr:hypothetical protein [Polaromonas naphthalenivorans]ABM38157.1 hypothetical protein Pnap_2857 [Polaromonas naphthalenivorans CJ2]